MVARIAYTLVALCLLSACAKGGGGGESEVVYISEGWQDISSSCTYVQPGVYGSIPVDQYTCQSRGQSCTRLIEQGHSQSLPPHVAFSDCPL